MANVELHPFNGRFVGGGAKPDMVEHPPHYNRGGFEAADVIDAFELPYHLATVTKYVLRCQYKGEKLQDLRKAEWHLKREIAIEEKRINEST